MDRTETALRAFKRAWLDAPAPAARLGAIRALAGALANDGMFGRRGAPTILRGLDSAGPSDLSCYIPRAHAIILTGHLSIITALHELAHAGGAGEDEATRWSLGWFQRVWPIAWRSLVRDEAQPAVMRRAR